MSEFKRHYPIRRGKTVRGVFVEAELLDLSLEATGLGVHILAHDGDLIDEAALRAMFPSRDISAALAELQHVGLIQISDVAPPDMVAAVEAALPSRDAAGVVYLVEAAGRYKIGVTKQMSARLGSLQTGSPYPMRLVYSERVVDCVRAEQLAHSLLSKYRLHGEWFSCTEAEAMRAMGAAIEAVKPKRDAGET